MADVGLTSAEKLRLYDKACLAWSEARDSKIPSWQFEREGREGEFETVGLDEITKFIDQLVNDRGLESPGDPESPEYWAKARAIIADELDRTLNPEDETEFQAVQPDEVTLKNLEEIAADQAQRRGIPIEKAREMVWKTLSAQAKATINEAADSRVENLPDSLQIKQRQQVATAEKSETTSASPSQKYLDQEMENITQRAERRSYSLRREPDKALFEAIKSVLTQILRNSNQNQAVGQAVFLADDQSPEPDYGQHFDSPGQKRSLGQASGMGRRIAGEVAQRLTKKGLQSAAQKLGLTALKTGAETVARGALLKGASGLIAAIVSGPAGWIIGAAMILNGIVGLFTKGGIGKFFKKLFGGAVSQGQIYAKQGMDAAGASGFLGAIIGGIMGLAGGPLGVIGGVVGLGFIGGMIGRSAGSFFGALFSGDIKFEPGRGITIASAKKKKGFFVFLASAEILAGGAFAAIALIILIIVFFLNQNKQQDQGTPVAFKVSITANPTKLSDWNSDSQTTIEYTVQVTANSNLDLKKTKINVKLTDKNGRQFQLLAPQDLVLSKSNLAAGESVHVPYDFAIPGRYDSGIFADSKLYGQVEVTGQVENEPEETWSATALTTIGNPPFNQPYGFPAAGTITQLDIYPGICRITANDGTVSLVGAQQNSDGNYICVKPDGAKSFVYLGHSGTPLTSNLAIGYHNPIPGGMDIGQGGGNVPVFSTIDGTVIKSVFDLGPTIVRVANMGCIPNKIDKVVSQITGSGQPDYRFCKGALGGAVYIQSDDKKYVVSYLHLAEDGLIPQGTIVARGQQIGKTFPGRICEQTQGLPEMCTSSGPHVHYQIFLDNFSASQSFNDVNIAGSCLEGKILPAGSDPSKPQPAIGQTISQAVTECK